MSSVWHAAIHPRHLIELGHTRIAHISAPTGVVGTLRQRAYEDEMRAHGLGSHIAVEPAELTEETGYQAALRLLNREEPPTAIFAANDLSCMGALAAAAELGIGVPGRASLVGYDNSHLAKLRTICLTSVDGAAVEVGRQAADALLARIEEPARPGTTRLITPTLEVRGSTAPPQHPGIRSE